MVAIKRRVKPIRYTRLHDDGSIASAQRTIETKLQLPKGSVRLMYPSGRRARVDSTVGALKRQWSYLQTSWPNQPLQRRRGTAASYFADMVATPR